ncbi:MAG: universal stress protein, partial [Chloroflexi bacterium]|nr:universal stress protein [Chloroflexota bacterium]
MEDGDNAELQRKVLDGLRSDSTIDASGIEVVADAGTVTLDGHIGSDAERDNALGNTRQIPGVLALVDDLEVWVLAETERTEPDSPWEVKIMASGRMPDRVADDRAHERGLRILVPLDDSFQAQRVLVYAWTLATATHGALRPVRATDIEDATSFDSLASNAERLRDAGLLVEWSVLGGVDAETAIRTEAAAWQPDLIALATMKSYGLDRWLNGSVTENVVASARTPVLIVPPGWGRALADRPQPRVLVPLDGSPAAEQAAWLVVRLASLMPIDVVLMRAVHEDAAVHGTQQYLDHLVAALQSALPDGNVARRVVTGSPVQAILKTAQDLDADAIAMSTRGHSLEHRALIGGTARAVLDQTGV